MDTIKLITGEIFKDARGQISSLNTFHFEGVKRMYILHHPDTETRRGWNGHQFERKWFYCVKGSFELSVVTIDNWVSPSPALKPEVHHLTSEESALLCVPAGCASLIRATTPDSILIVLSDKTLAESAADSYRFDINLWTHQEVAQ